jgi:signal transduction histidine kinase
MRLMSTGHNRHSAEEFAHLQSLLAIHTALAAADDERSILAGIASYAMHHAQGCWLELHYVANTERIPVELRYAAGWYGDPSGTEASTHPTLHLDQVTALNDWCSQPNAQIILLEYAAEMQGGLVIIPLVCTDLLHGVLLIGWGVQRAFNASEREIYDAIQPSLASAVARRLAYLAEQQARQELEMLYRASAALNGANTAAQVQMAIGQLEQAMDAERFARRDGRIASAITTLTQTAMERIRLRRETEAARQRAEQYAAEAQKAAALEERNRLARQLHDSVSQALYGIALGARTARKMLDRDPMQAKEPLDYLLTLADAGLTEMRALIFDLRPDALETDGLIAALTKQANSVKTRHGINVLLDFCEEPELSGRVKEEVYRIIREALHNAVKHARASQIAIKARCSEHGLLIEIEDNGVGFDLQDSFPGHMGLRSMIERAHRLNAELGIFSTQANGTRITLHLPLPVADPLMDTALPVTP